MADEGRGGFWNRAGRRSGGYRATEIVVAPAPELTPEQQAAELERDILRGIREGSPIMLIVGLALASIGEQWAINALQKRGIKLPL